MRIAFLGGIFPNEYCAEIYSLSKGVVQSAADTFQKSILEGLGAFTGNVTLINMPFLGSYPKRYKKLFSPGGKFEIQSHYGQQNTLLGENIPYCNITFFKDYFIQRRATSTLREWSKDNSDSPKVILVYSLNAAFLKAAKLVKAEFPNTKIICIAPDLPLHMSAGGTSKIRQWNKQRNIKVIDGLLNHIDAFIFLTPYMAEALGVTTKPYEIIEGIYNNFDESISTACRLTSRKDKYVFYAGGLAIRYGIKRLVDAFMLISDPDIRLIICGDGDGRQYVEDAAAKDHRIDYRGTLPREEILNLAKNASVLVNPRSAEGDFTKYSFPSKTMEYLASEIPTILYQLDGIPPEYYDYCIALTDDSTQGLSDAIISCLNLSDKERNALGEKAREFILTQKNPFVQVKKLEKLINQLTHVDF